MNKSPLPAPPIPNSSSKSTSPPVSPRTSGDKIDNQKVAKKESTHVKSPRPDSAERRDSLEEKKDRKSSKDKDSKHHHHHKDKEKEKDRASPAISSANKSPSLRLPLPVPPAAAAAVTSAPPAASSAPTPLATGSPTSAWKRTPSSNSLRSAKGIADALTTSQNNIGQTRFQRSSPRGGNSKVTCIGPYQFDRTAPLGRCTFLGIDTRFSPSAPLRTSAEQLSAAVSAEPPSPKYLQVVVKVVEKRSPAADYLKLEYQLLKSFDHPHVVRVLDTLEDDTSYYFITEYLTGGRLMHELGSRGKLGPEELLRQKMTAIVSAVQYNHHMRAVIYRELLLDWIVYFKPENVYIGALGVIKVGPFGYLDPKKHPRTWVRQWSYASFAAPEILTAKSYLMAVDCWSLGILLFLMATGTYPFHGATAEEMIAAVYQPLRPSPSLPLSTDLSSLLTALLTPHPYKRIPCSEVLKHAWFNKAPLPVSGTTKASTASSNQPALSKSVKIADSTSNNSTSASTEESATPKSSTRSSIFGLFSSSKPNVDGKGDTKHRTGTSAGTNVSPATTSNVVVTDTKSK